MDKSEKLKIVGVFAAAFTALAAVFAAVIKLIDCIFKVQAQVA